MTPQSQFMLTAPVKSGLEAGLRQLLLSMNSAPGMADPANSLVPFGSFERIHYARFVLIDDANLGDLAVYAIKPPVVPLLLVFMGDVDGAALEVLADLARRAAPGLRQIFAHCEAFDAKTDVLAWMTEHQRPIAATYINWVGRTVVQIKQERALAVALAANVSRSPLGPGQGALARRRDLIAFVKAQQEAGRLPLSPPAPTPLGWTIANLIDLLATPLLGILVLPFVLLLAPFWIVHLRKLETSDPEICPRPASTHVAALTELEDRDVTNQFTAAGPIKPGLFRRTLVTVLFFLLNYTARHIFVRGFLTRVQTIHFARWVFLDDKVRVLFASNYDGGHEAYMDDFINKVGWGLNLVFSSGVGYPTTNWLIEGGARREQQFKDYQRRHQLPSQVWYKAYPGLTLTDMEHNARIRAGLLQDSMSEAQAAEWLRLL